MNYAPRAGSRSKAHGDRLGDPLDGLVNLFDLSLVLSVGFLLAALSSIGATGLITGSSGAGTPFAGQPPVTGPTATGKGQQVGTVVRLENGQYVFVPSGPLVGGAPTPITGAPTAVTGVAPTTPTATPGTGAVTPPTSVTPQTTVPPASGATAPASPGVGTGAPTDPNGSTLNNGTSSL